MEFFSTLHYDVKLLLVAGALALLAGLLTGSKRSEHRYMTLFAVVMLVAGWRFYEEQAQDVAAAERTDTAAAGQVVRRATSHSPAR
jgi:hypothetical protein